MARPMNVEEQRQHTIREWSIEAAIDHLRYAQKAGDENEDIAVALARLEEWCSANEGRWTTE